MSLSEVKRLRPITENMYLADLAKGRRTWINIWLLIDVATTTGLRVAEMARLKRKDLNLSREPFIHVLGKGNKHRTVYIAKNLVNHLRKHI